jgi:hypothetical protein
MKALIRNDITDETDLGNPQLRNQLQSLQNAPPLPPLRFSVVTSGSGVRVTIVNDGPMGRLNGAVRYDVYNCDTLDSTFAAGKAAGFARSVCLAPSIPATGIDHTESSAIFTDPIHGDGWFFICGVDAQGNRSDPSEPAQVVQGVIDTTVPGDVQHLQVSESGTTHNGTVLSELSVTCSPPDDTSNFGGLQLYLKDFTSLGDIQEGFFCKWIGSGSVNFDVDYPVPRRKGSFSATATNGSPSVVAASGWLSVAQAGDYFELAGRLIKIDVVSDTTLTLHANWDAATMTVADWAIVALVTVYGVSIGKSGSRRDDVTNAPSVAVLMDGNLSAPNYPGQMYISNAGVSVLIEWDQVAGQTIDDYAIYRSAGSGLDTGMLNVPPTPAASTKLLDKVPQAPSLIAGSTYARMQYHDSNFTLYDLEANNAFIWYVTTRNIRGDESRANYAAGNCQRTITGEIDPTQVGRNPGKNMLYNGALAGTAGNVVLANDATQDAFMGLAAGDLPGRPYGAASGQANGTGRFEGYTRWESSDGGTGASGSVKHQSGDEVHILPPGVNKSWFLYQEIGAWDEATNKRKKVAKGEVYVVSLYLSKVSTQPDGVIHVYVEQYNNGTPQGHSKRRFRDTNSNLVTSSTPLTITCSDLVTTPTRYQAGFQLDSALSPTAQIRVNFEWADGTVGEIVVRRAMDNAGEAAAQWTADMGDPSISIPVPTNPLDPLGDDRSGRLGDAIVFR